MEKCSKVDISLRFLLMDLSFPLPWRERFDTQHSTLEVAQGKIVGQSPTDATRFWWHSLTKEIINLPLGCLQGGGGLRQMSSFLRASRPTNFIPPTRAPRS